MSMNWNPYHVPRNTEGFHPRTHISDPYEGYQIFQKPNRVCQLKLYHWCRSIDYVNGVSIADLHKFLFYNNSYVSKNHLGRTVLQAVSYDPRTLKGKTKVNPRARMIYTFRNREDLQYGLEWMLSMWIWRITDDEEVMKQRTIPERQNRLAKIFEQLARDEEDIVDSYWVAGTEEMGNRKNPDWPSIWAKYQMISEDDAPPRLSPEARPKLQSLL